MFISYSVSFPLVRSKTKDEFCDVELNDDADVSVPESVAGEVIPFVEGDDVVGILDERFRAEWGPRPRWFP